MGHRPPTRRHFRSVGAAHRFCPITCSRDWAHRLSSRRDIYSIQMFPDSYHASIFNILPAAPLFSEISLIIPANALKTKIRGRGYRVLGMGDLTEVRRCPYIKENGNQRVAPASRNNMSRPVPNVGKKPSCAASREIRSSPLKPNAGLEWATRPQLYKTEGCHTPPASAERRSSPLKPTPGLSGPPDRSLNHDYGANRGRRGGFVTPLFVAKPAFNRPSWNRG